MPLHQSLFRRLLSLQRTELLIMPKAVPSHAHRSLQTLESTTAVSKNEIKSLLDSKKYSYKLGHSSFVLQCPFCKKGGCTDAQMFVNYNTGSVVCRPCALRGTWPDFLAWSCQGKSPPILSPTTSASPSTAKADSADSEQRRTEHAQKVWAGMKKWAESPVETVNTVREVFNIKNLHSKALSKYLVRTGTFKFSTKSGSQSELPCVAFPWYHGKQLVRVKLVTLSPEEERRTSLEPSEGQWGLFGWNTVRSTDKEIVLTAGEFDAVAVYQRTGKPAVALPHGTTTLPPELLPYLEQFERVYLWLGDSVQAKQAASHFAKKLDLNRCFLVSCPESGGPMPAALQALSTGANLTAAIASSRHFEHKQIVSFNQLRRDVYAELSNREVVCGVKWRRFPLLTSVLKGHRPGELTVFTGPTGRGKTTLLGELSLDLCSQGVATLWGSFEIKNVRLAKTLLKQYSGLNIEQHLGQYDYWADQFQQLPLYFMGFYGSADISSVVEAMSHAVYIHDIQHVIVDNLQFMVGAQVSSIMEQYSIQNQAIAALRKFASSQNVHVTVVIHPRKEDDSNQLTTASIFGTAKATQEADNVIILQSPLGKDKYLQVTKNRFDGDLGKVPLYWDKESCTMSGYFSRGPPQAPSHDQAGNAPPTPLKGHTSSGRSSARDPSELLRYQRSNLIGQYQGTSLGSLLSQQATVSRGIKPQAAVPGSPIAKSKLPPNKH